MSIRMIALATCGAVALLAAAAPARADWDHRDGWGWHGRDWHDGWHGRWGGPPPPVYRPWAYAPPPAVYYPPPAYYAPPPPPPVYYNFGMP